MNVAQLIETLNTLPPEMEVVFRTSVNGEPFNFSFCDKVEIAVVEMEDEPDFVCAMMFEDSDDDIPDIMRFLN
jgi:hypothetical protein